MKLFEHLVRDQNVLGFTFQWKIIIEANNTVDVGPLWRVVRENEIKSNCGKVYLTKTFAKILQRN